MRRSRYRLLPRANIDTPAPATPTERSALKILSYRPDLKGTAFMSDIDPATRVQLEAAAFRALVAHLRERTDVQNIDLMNMAGFCRNCLSNWYMDAASGQGIDLTKDQARQIIYGMPYEEYKRRHQTEATPEQRARFAQGDGHG